MKFPRRFFKRIFGTVLQDHHLDVEVRCLSPFNRKKSHKDEDSYPVKQFWSRSLSELQNLWPEIEELNLKGYDIHFTVVARRRKFQGKKEHPLPEKPYFACLWADLDVGKGKPYRKLKEAFRAVKAVELRPDIIVESGSGLHAYYLLREPRTITRERAEALLSAITSRLHGDKGAARATRLMRVPNTYNWKKGEKKLARAHYFPRMGYRLRDLEAVWKVDSDHSYDEEHSGKKEKRGLAGTYADFFLEHVKNLKPVGKKFEALGLCPFHDDEQPSFCVNLETGLWKCQSSECDAGGNIEQFCQRANIPVPPTAIQRFPRLRVIPLEEEWDSEKVFQEVYDYIISQIRFTHSYQPVLVTLWAMGTYAYMQFPCYGHLWLNSPTTHSGKTKAEDVLSTICYKATEPQLAPTAAVVFRFPSSMGGTLILDEIDRISPENQSDVIAVLNHYKSTGGVLRNVPGKNKQYTLQEFKVYCPKVIAGINNLPETTQDRCFKIYLHRKRKDEKVERFMPGEWEEREPLRNQLEAWAVRDGFALLYAYQQRGQLGVPAKADDRLRDIMEPLFAIASLLPEWVKGKLVEATEKLARDRHAHEVESNPVVLGVQALRENFPKDEDIWRLRSDKALEIFQDDVPGIETVGQVQGLLRKLGFRSQRVRFGKHVLRAYLVSRKALDKLIESYGAEQEVA